MGNVAHMHELLLAGDEQDCGMGTANVPAPRYNARPLVISPPLLHEPGDREATCGRSRAAAIVPLLEPIWHGRTVDLTFVTACRSQ